MSVLPQKINKNTSLAKKILLEDKNDEGKK